MVITTYFEIDEPILVLIKGAKCVLAESIHVPIWTFFEPNFGEKLIEDRPELFFVQLSSGTISTEPFVPPVYFFVGKITIPL